MEVLDVVAFFSWMHPRLTLHFFHQLCAEKLVADLVNKDTETLAPVLLNMLQAVTKSPQQYLSEDLNATLLRDAVYCACTLTAHDLYDHLSFDPWFSNQLAVEASNPSPK